MVNKRIEELETVCAEGYMVMRDLAERCGLLDARAVQIALENLSHGKLIHNHVIPFMPRLPNTRRFDRERAEV